MSLEHHDLGHDFPEHKDSIHELKLNNAHFKKLYDEYHDLDKRVYRIEAEDEKAVSDEHLEDLKKQRIKLKDELYSMLVATTAE